MSSKGISSHPAEVDEPRRHPVGRRDDVGADVAPGDEVGLDLGEVLVVVVEVLGVGEVDARLLANRSTRLLVDVGGPVVEWTRRCRRHRRSPPSPPLVVVAAGGEQRRSDRDGTAPPNAAGGRNVAVRPRADGDAAAGASLGHCAPPSGIGRRSCRSRRCGRPRGTRHRRRRLPGRPRRGRRAGGRRACGRRPRWPRTAVAVARWPARPGRSVARKMISRDGRLDARGARRGCRATRTRSGRTITRTSSPAPGAARHGTVLRAVDGHVDRAGVTVRHRRPRSRLASPMKPATKAVAGRW